MTQLTHTPGEMDLNLLLLDHLSEHLLQGTQPSLRTLSLRPFMGVRQGFTGTRQGGLPVPFSVAEKSGMARLETIGEALGIKVETPGGPWKDKAL
jgi:hypothetical protein